MANPRQFATLWLPLAPVRAATGALMFAKGSHKDDCTYFACELPCETVGECYETETIDDLEPGDARGATDRGFMGLNLKFKGLTQNLGLFKALI